MDETDCISHHTNTLGKGMNQIILKLRLKIDLVSYPARAEGLGKYDIRTKREVFTSRVVIDCNTYLIIITS